MEIEKNELVVLSDDGKEVALENLNQLSHAARQLYLSLKENTLEKDLCEKLFLLCESYTGAAAKAMGYDSSTAKKIEERYREIRKINDKVKELEGIIVRNTQVEGMAKLMQSLHIAVYDWWKSHGFNLVTDDSFGQYGYKGRFCLSTTHISFMSRKPVTEQKNHENKLQQMIDEGYEFVLEEGNEYVLLDTPGNRKMISNLVKTKLPSIEIYQWGNVKIYNSNEFKLIDFTGYVSDLSEIKAIMDELEEAKKQDK